MSLELPFGIKPVNPVAVDYYSGPWSGASTQEAINAANSGIPAAVRFTGLTANLVIAGEAKKYWYASGISDSHLVNFGDTLLDGNISVSGQAGGVAFFDSNGLITDDPKFTFNKDSDLLILGNNTSSSQSGIAIETTGGTHGLHVENNIQKLRSYNRTYFYNGGDIWLDSKGGQTGSNTPRFLRGITLEPLTSLLQPLVIEGKPSQAGNLTEWIDDLGTVLAHVDSGGSAMFRDLTVDNMTVSGTFTYVNSENVTIADKQIELASNSGSAIGGDSLVDQGGIVVKSTDGDKSFLWSQSSNAWTANKNLVVQGTITNPAMQTFVNNNVLFNNDVTVTNDLFVSGAISLLAPLNITGLTSTTERYIDLERENGASVLTIDSTGSSTTRMQGDNVFNIETDSSAGVMRLGNVNGRHGVYITNEGYNVGIGRVIPAVDGVTIGIAEYPVMLNGSGTFIYNNNNVDETNYERLEFKWDTNVAVIDSTAAGTGTARAFDISYNGSRRFRGDSAFSYIYQANGTYLVFGSDDFKPQSDSTIELGATGNRWSTTYTDTITIGDGVDAVLTADAADTLAMRNGTTHQTMHLYGTYADASNYERMVIGEFNNNDDFVITTEGAGTGVNKALYLSYGGVGAGNRNIGILSGETRFYKDIRPANDGSNSCGVIADRWSATYTKIIDAEAGSATDVPAVIKGAAAQSANLTEWQDIVGNALAHVGSGGTISTSGDLVANTHLKFKGGNGPDIFSSSSHAYLRDATGVSKLRWGSGASIFTFTGFTPNVSNTYDIGEEGNRTYRSLHLGSRVTSSGVQTSGVHLSDHVPASTTNTLYNDGGELKWNGAGISPTGTPSGVAFFGADGLLKDSTDLRFEETNGRLGIGLVSGGISNNLTVYDSSQNYPLRVGNNTANTHGSWTGMTFFNSTNTGGSSTLDGQVSIRAYRYGTGLIGELEFLLGGTSVMRIDTEGHTGLGTITPDAKLHTVSTNATDIGIIAQGAAAQSANLTEWQNSAGDILAEVDATGQMNIYNSGGGTNDYERLEVKWDTNVATIASTAAGTGTQRDLSLIAGTDFANVIQLGDRNNQRVRIGPASNQGIGLFNNVGSFQIKNGTYTSFKPITASAFIGSPGAYFGVGNTRLYAETDVFSQRNGANAQAFNIYNTYADASNYERLEFKWDANEAIIRPTYAGSGTYRTISMQSAITGRAKFEVSAGGHGHLSYGNTIGLEIQNALRVMTRVPFSPNTAIAGITLGENSKRWPTTYTNIIDVDASGATSVPAVIKGAAAQTANLTEWQASDGTVVAMVEPDGSISSSGDISASGSLRSSRFMASDDGVLTAPAFSFDSQTNMGIYRSASNQLNITCGANYGINLSPYNLSITSGTSFGWKTSNSLNGGHSYSTQLHQEANGVIGQYSEYVLEHYTPQQYNIYNYWGGNTSNWERLETKWDNHVATIQTAAAGSGVRRDIHIEAEDSVNLRNSSGAVLHCGTSSRVTTYKDLVPHNDGTVDLGFSNRRWDSIWGEYLNVDGIATNVETFTAASDTLDALNNVALCDCTSNNITINLPAASTASGLQYHIKKTDSSSNVITISPDGSETIDGQSSYVVNNQYESITLVCDGSNWFII